MEYTDSYFYMDHCHIFFPYANENDLVKNRIEMQKKQKLFFLDISFPTFQIFFLEAQSHVLRGGVMMTLDFPQPDVCGGRGQMYKRCKLDISAEEHSFVAIVKKFCRLNRG